MLSSGLETGKRPLASLIFMLLAASAPAPANEAAEDYRQELEELVTSAVACKAGRLLLADMHPPALYGKSRSCVRVDPAGSALTHYFSDPACSRKLAFQPTSYSDYCGEMVAPGEANTRLGNAASWQADKGQVNDPAPGTPSRKWTLSPGTRLALSSEPLNGKTIPFMKRLRYREVVTPSNARPLYWSCGNLYSGPCEPGASPGRHGILLGYIKKSAGHGTVPLYWACVSAYASGGCERKALVTKPTRYGGALLGYLSLQPRSGTRPLYWGCKDLPRAAMCAADISRDAGGRSLEANSALLGHVYDKSIIKGTCALEMRVYKKNVNATGLTPLLAFHGGGWRYRGGAFVGFEAQLAHYTEDGFVVFVPFYRLAGTADGNSDCNEAPWNAITADAEAALDWVKRHAAAFGAKRVPPAVMGQSAGAHLAGWLLAHRAEEVSAGLLFYGPSDFRDFLEQAVPEYGQYHDRFSPSLRILSGFYGSDVRAIDLGANPRFIDHNSYHDYVRAGGIPPVFLIHGKADVTVPSNQSVLMCNAYGGNAEDMGGGAQRRATYVCGRSGRLHLFQQGGHGLDGCLRKGAIDACAAGDESSRKLLVDSLKKARAWLRSRTDEAGG